MHLLYTISPRQHLNEIDAPNSQADINETNQVGMTSLVSLPMSWWLFAYEGQRKLHEMKRDMACLSNRACTATNSALRSKRWL